MLKTCKRPIPGALYGSGFDPVLVKWSCGWASDEVRDLSSFFILTEVGPFRSIQLADPEPLELLDRPASAYVLEKKRILSYYLTYIVRGIWQIEAAALFALRKYHKIFEHKYDAMYAGKGRADLSNYFRSMTFPEEKETSQEIADLRLQKQFLKDWGFRIEDAKEEIRDLELMDFGLPHSSLRVRGFTAAVAEWPTSYVETCVATHLNREMVICEIGDPVEDPIPCLEAKESPAKTPEYVGLDKEMVDFLVNF